MKEKVILQWVIIVIIISFALIIYKREVQGEILVYNSNSVIMGDYHSERLIVVVNQRRIKDRQECAEEIVKKCRENDFQNVLFSYDLSKPDELDVSVCLNEKQAEKGEEEFRFLYVQEEEDGTYNIIDNPEKFHIEMLSD